MRAVSAVLILLVALPLSAQKVKVIAEWNHAVSRPLRALAMPLPAGRTAQGPAAEPPETETPVTPLSDPVVQQTAGPKLVANPGMNVLGLGTGFTGPQGTFEFSWAPPDPNASVGASQVVETVNKAMAVFDKQTGAVILGPVRLASLWNGFNDSCSNPNLLVDPVVLYDKHAGVWVIEAVTLTLPYFSCFAVSTTSDATGTYNLYAFEVQGNGYNATPRFGVWPDGYYLSARIYSTSTTYVGPQACAVDRSQMLAGQAATMQCFQINDTTIDGLMPSDLDGASLPPAGSPNYYLIQGPAGTHSLYLYKFHVDFTTPANSVFTGPTILKVAPYTPAAITAQVPQPGTKEKLTGIGNFLMHRLAYRNLPAARPPHESLVVTHAVQAGTAGSRRIGMRWYELRNLGTSPLVYQQGTFSPDTANRWMGSIAMDKVGNIALGYSISSSSIYPAIRHTGRVPGDPRGTMESEVTLFDGIGHQAGSDRWGDYTSMSVDPANDCTLWYTNEYMAANGTFAWATRLFSFTFPSCR